MADVRPEAARVADRFTRLMRVFAKAKAQFMAAAEHDVEWSAQLALKCLANDGPMRAGALAEAIHSDPSTVSRQVAALVKDGLVERQADPLDGRASVLVLTDKAKEVIAAHDASRNERFNAMLADWSAADLATFATLLERFTADFEAQKPHWLPGRAGNPLQPAGRE